MHKTLPFVREQVVSWAKKYSTPFYVYDEASIRASARRLISAFSWNQGFKEYFAVKATPTPAIMQILKDEGCGMDCSSLAELVLSERGGITGESVMFTSNDTPYSEYAKAGAIGAIINLDAYEHIDYITSRGALPELLSFRYNPGPVRTGNAIIGKPEEAKFGMTREQLFAAYARAQALGVRRFGLHTMVASNELDRSYFIETARMLFDLVRDLREKGISLEFVNLGGGIGIPYKPEQEAVDVAQLGEEIRVLYEKYTLAPLKLFMECGRYITGPHGYLVTQVRHLKETYKKYAGLDATMADLMRPGMYGAYHHMTVLGKEDAPLSEKYDVVGSLCENNDKFAIDRMLPTLAEGDYVVIHDAGAHGRSMGFNYNGKLRAGEFLLEKDGTLTMIRRSETLDDYFATLTF